MSAVPKITLVEPEAEKTTALERRALAVAKTAKAFVIVTPDDFRCAGDFLRDVKTALAEIDELCDPPVEAAHKAHKAALAVKRRLTAPFLEAESVLKPLMAKYQEQEEKRRKEEERRLQEEANRKAEEERLLLAIDAEQAGDKESAEELLAAPVEAPVVVVKSETKVAGVSFRDNWKSRVVDLRALARGVAEGTVPATAILPNQAFLDNQARASKGEIKYPGVQTYSEKVVSAGRG